LNGTSAIRIDAFRRNLQRTYLDLMNDKLNGRAPVTDDQRPFIRGELKALNGEIGRAIARTTDRAVRLHLEDAHDLIVKILDPKFAAAAPATGMGALLGRGFEEETEIELQSGLVCWPETAIRMKR
jgi:hypothetical protein